MFDLKTTMLQALHGNVPAFPSVAQGTRLISLEENIEEWFEADVSYKLIFFNGLHLFLPPKRFAKCDLQQENLLSSICQPW